MSNEITFGTLHPTGELTSVRVIKRSDIMACPTFILVPEHYRDDGSCLCKVDEVNKDHDFSGDCIATVFERCPACGEVIDYCLGHGEIGNPEGFTILQAHDAEDHSGCVKVSDIFGGEVE